MASRGCSSPPRTFTFPPWCWKPPWCCSAGGGEPGSGCPELMAAARGFAAPGGERRVGNGEGESGGVLGRSGVRSCPWGADGTRGQQGPAAATAGDASGASWWGSAGGGTPTSRSGGASPQPAPGRHPSASSVLLLEPPLHLLWTPGMLRASSAAPAPISLAPWHLCRAGSDSGSPPVPTGWLGLTGKGPPRRVAASLCSDALGGDRAWHVRGGACAWRVSAGGRPRAACPRCRVPLFLTPVSVCMVHAALLPCRRRRR